MPYLQRASGCLTLGYAFRGYKGRVVNATETLVRMELEAQYKTVSVPRTVLPMSDGGVPESANRRPGFNPPRTPGYNAPQTPGYGAGNRTPMHAWGSRTPMHPGMTPSHPGSAVSLTLSPPPPPPIQPSPLLPIADYSRGVFSILRVFKSLAFNLQYV